MKKKDHIVEQFKVGDKAIVIKRGTNSSRRLFSTVVTIEKISKVKQDGIERPYCTAIEEGDKKGGIFLEELTKNETQLELNYERKIY